ncbi:hypothetical protein [Terrimonas ferruginea]|uniref:hypothetical protein n=1 Tax=Terrimonas ferruginea TaxID=249 RepID=UPI00040EEE28|nr:hypothetical protein [Terrimonas ferruginea]
MSETASLIHLAEQVAQQPASDDLNRLTEQIRQLINEDFNALVSLLYRQDVSEHKLRALLAGQPEADSAVLITGLLVERMAQKIKSRQTFSRRDPSIPDEEKW